MSLIVMCGILGLAVDLGWSFFVRRNAQSYADAGALAAAEQALKVVGALAPFSCGSTGYSCVNNFSCASGVAIDSTDNKDNGCLYMRGTSSGAGQNTTYSGFINGTNGGRAQSATLSSGLGTSTSCNGLPFTCYYWVQTRSGENIPQLFSAVLGNRMGTAAATATAAVVGIPAFASIWLTNRQFDTVPIGQNNTATGVDFYMGGNATVTAGAGIRLASNIVGAGQINSGSGSVSAGYTWVRQTPTSAGSTTAQGTDGNAGTTPRWPYQDQSKDAYFQDPLGGLSQPPLPTTSVPDCPIIEQSGKATIDGSVTPVLAPGNYYAVNANGTPTLNPVVIRGSVRFGASAGATMSSVFTHPGQASTCPVGVTDNSGSGFGNYFIYGGLTNQGGNVTATFEPGRYVLAGMVNPNPNNSNDILNLSSGASLTDVTANGATGAAGEMFILTNGTYPGVSTQLSGLTSLQSAIQSQGTNYTFGSTNIQAGNSNAFTLTGLVPGNSTVDSSPGLKPFENVLFWQDQRNSRVAYTSTGKVDTSCLAAQANPDAGCATGLVNATSPQFSLQGNANSRLAGIIYQPRGAWIMLGGSTATANIAPATMIVSGAIQIQGGGNINIAALPNPPEQRSVTLVQ